MSSGRLWLACPRRNSGLSVSVDKSTGLTQGISAVSIQNNMKTAKGCCQTTYWLRMHREIFVEQSFCYASLAKIRVAFYSVDSTFPDHQIRSNVHETWLIKVIRKL